MNINNLHKIEKGEHIFEFDKPLFGELIVPHGVGRIIVKYMDPETQEKVLKVSKRWAAVVLEQKASQALVDRYLGLIVKGFETMVLDYLRNSEMSGLVVAFKGIFSLIRSESIQEGRQLFKLGELEVLHKHWDDYMVLRKIEMPFFQNVRDTYLELNRQKYLGLLISPFQCDDAISNIVIPYLKTLIHQIKEGSQRSFEHDQIAENRIISVYGPKLSDAIKKGDGKPDWMDRMRVINDLSITEMGKKLSKFEYSWHIRKDVALRGK